MTGFEPGSSGIGDDHSDNCATSTAKEVFQCYLKVWIFWKVFFQVPEPALVHDPEKDGTAEISDEDRHHGEHGVHHGQLHQFLGSQIFLQLVQHYLSNLIQAKQIKCA